MVIEFGIIRFVFFNVSFSTAASLFLLAVDQCVSIPVTDVLQGTYHLFVLDCDLPDREVPDHSASGRDGVMQPEVPFKIGLQFLERHIQIVSDGHVPRKGNIK